MYPTALCTLAEAKDVLNIPNQDTGHDAKIQRGIDGIRPVIEAMIGPIIPTVYDEKYSSNGSDIIVLRQRPNVGFGADPILDLIAVTEYYGQIAYTLTIVADPSAGSIYSVELDPRLGMITRRTSGGGTTAFAPGRNTVHVVYRAGQNTVPMNVKEAALELIRVNYQHTQQTGRSRQQMLDDDGPGMMTMGFFMPNRVKEMLSPNRRGPSIA